MMPIDATHDPSRRSWVESANIPETDFPIQNLPLGIFSLDGKHRRPGVAIGTSILGSTRIGHRVATAGRLEPPLTPSAVSRLRPTRRGGGQGNRGREHRGARRCRRGSPAPARSAIRGHGPYYGVPTSGGRPARAVPTGTAPDQGSGLASRSPFCWREPLVLSSIRSSL
jgi:hypothetical protein